MSDTLITIEVKGLDTVVDKMKALPERIRGRLREVIVRDTQQLAALVRRKLSGEVLQVRTGRLLGSVRSEMVENNQTVYGRVYSQGVPYARIHEYGGQTAPHLILPVNAQALRFMVGGAVVFAKSVNHPGSRIPSRSYMRSSLAEMREQLIDDMNKAAKPELN